MSSRPWYAFYPKDYEQKTAHLTFLQDSAYRRLLDRYYMSGKPLPANADHLHRVCRAFAEDEQNAIAFVLKEYFKLTPGGYVQDRVEDELRKADDLSETRRNAAKTRYSKAANADVLQGSLQPHLHTQSQSQSQSHLAAATGIDDKANFQTLYDLLGFDGNNHKNWLEFIAMQAHHGLDFEKHILPAARAHVASGKRGKTLAYIRPKAIELRDEAAIIAAAPAVLIEDCPVYEWEGRLEYYKNHADYEPEKRWPARWGPIWSDPGTRVPPKLVEAFRSKLNGSCHAAV